MRTLLDNSSASISARRALYRAAGSEPEIGTMPLSPALDPGSAVYAKSLNVAELRRALGVGE